jgi:hypothetical protein
MTKHQQLTEAETLRLIDQNEQAEEQIAVIKHEFRDIEAHASEETLNQLSAAGDVLEQMSWKIGWWTDKLYRELEANGAKKNYELVCYYVAISRLRGNRSHNTVKKWALTARFFTEQQAKDFHSDMLPFNHFTYAASFGNQKAPDGVEMWKKVLAFSYAKMLASDIGKPCTVKDLQREFEGAAPKSQNAGNLQYTPVTPMPYTAGLEGVRPLKDTDDDEYALTGFANALQVVIAGLPLLGRRFPVISKVLAGISMQLATVIEKLQSGDDLEETD